MSSNRRGDFCFGKINIFGDSMSNSLSEMASRLDELDWFTLEELIFTRYSFYLGCCSSNYFMIWSEGYISYWGVIELIELDDLEWFMFEERRFILRSICLGYSCINGFMIWIDDSDGVSIFIGDEGRALDEINFLWKRW